MIEARSRKILGAILILLLVTFSAPVKAVFSNISTSSKWAWNDLAGWIDFYANDTGANVVGTEVKRWGIFDNDNNTYIALNCDSLPPGATNDCTPTFAVENNGSGVLSGYAWSDEYGWISFYDDLPYAYGVQIDANGDFQGFAWNDVIGWISFNCANDHDASTGGTQSVCGTYFYEVNTSWRSTDPDPVPGNYLESVTFDTGATDGFAINSIYWEGSLPVQSTVGFQIAVATSTTFTSADFVGPDGSISTVYEPVTGDTGGGNAIIVHGGNHHAFESGYRYFRYRVYLDKVSSSPVVGEVNINWTK